MAKTSSSSSSSSLSPLLKEENRQPSLHQEEQEQQNSPTHQVDPTMNQMMVIEVNFGKEKSDSIIVHFNDDANDLASDFVRRHKLKSTGRDSLHFASLHFISFLPLTHRTSNQRTRSNSTLPTHIHTYSSTSCGQVHSGHNSGLQGDEQRATTANTSK